MKIIVENTETGERKEIDSSENLPDGWIPIYTADVTAKKYAGIVFLIVLMLLILFLKWRAK